MARMKGTEDPSVAEQAGDEIDPTGVRVDPREIQIQQPAGASGWHHLDPFNIGGESGDGTEREDGSFFCDAPWDWPPSRRPRRV